MQTIHVNPAAPTQPAALTTVADGPPICDKCGEVATFLYAFPWGDTGKVCATHAMLAQQTADNLSRSVVISALPPPVNVPLTRDERARLKGEVYALEAEAEDLKARGLALYEENTRLTVQVQALSVRSSETIDQLSEARGELVTLQQLLEESDSKRGALADEVSRLRTLTKFSEPSRHVVGAPPAPPAGPSHGLDDRDEFVGLPKE